MGDMSDGAIASPHWEACDKCRHYEDGVCILGDSISMSIVMGDWIVCDDYESCLKPWPNGDRKTDGA
jgi:hypothetical protein